MKYGKIENYKITGTCLMQTMIFMLSPSAYLSTAAEMTIFCTSEVPS